MNFFQFPAPVQQLIDNISAIPGVYECFSCPKPLHGVAQTDLARQCELDNIPVFAASFYCDDPDEIVLLQSEIIFERSAEAWIGLEFLSWWVRDRARHGYPIQLRPSASSPETNQEVLLGRSLKFYIEVFVVEDTNDMQKTLAMAGELADSLELNRDLYSTSFANPAPFRGDVDSI